MALGSRLFRLLRSNAVVDVQAGTPTPAAGTQLAWANVAASVDVLVSQVETARDEVNGVLIVRHSCTVAGVHPALARPDIRLRVRQAVEGLTGLVGQYLSVNNPGSSHPKGSAGLVQARINLRCETMVMPGSAPEEL